MGAKEHWEICWEDLPFHLQSYVPNADEEGLEDASLWTISKLPPPHLRTSRLPGEPSPTADASKRPIPICPWETIPAPRWGAQLLLDVVRQPTIWTLCRTRSIFLLVYVWDQSKRTFEVPPYGPMLFCHSFPLELEVICLNLPANLLPEWSPLLQ